MDSSPRPKKNPFYTADSKKMKSSPRPKGTPEKMNKRAEDKNFENEINRQLGAAAKGYKSGGKVSKMAGGGMCRGMGAATKGGKYKA